MKKLVTLLLILALLLPAAAPADGYTPKIGMTIEQFLASYNAVPCPLGAPYSSLSIPIRWTEWNGHHVAWFTADKEAKITILLMTEDPSDQYKLSSGLDLIQICAESDSDFIPLFGVTQRCVSLFATNLLGTSLAGHNVAGAITYYYENNMKNKGYLSFCLVGDSENLALSLFYDNMYYFQISAKEYVQ